MERAVLRELATGATYEMTAYRLGVSRNTVGHHVMRAHAKLDAGSSIEAFIRLGWLRPT
jgi:DNA-binding CsgD family transcriptional regulator